MLAQSFLDEPGFAAHFAIFCLASAAHERADQAFAVDALAERIEAALQPLAVEHAALDSPYYDGLRFDWLHRLAADRKLTLVAAMLAS